jgi:hypothetical protein
VTLAQYQAIPDADANLMLPETEWWSALDEVRYARIVSPLSLLGRQAYL